MAGPERGGGAGAGGASGIVQWQMDIAGLTQLFINAGAHGLKQIALAGVDVHTIGALLTLGNLVPASMEYRKRLNTCRSQQKKSRSWIYKAIELGTATNFLADELLKTRAGENVVALFTAVMPVLSENCYTDAILTLFNSNRIDPDSTPGVGQLQRLRNSLLPFADAMDIKNRIMQYHLLFRKYNTTLRDPHFAIPRAETMSHLIQVLRRIEMGDGGYKLLYRGLRGAAWTTAYAWDILGLGVCMIVPTAEGEVPIPISGDFETAQVLLYVAQDGASIELCRTGIPEDFIEQTSVSAVDLEWTIDCDTINYFTAQHPDLGSPAFRRKVSEFVAAKTLDSVTDLSGELSYSVNVRRSKFQLPPSLLSYQDFVLSAVQKRSLIILEMLGFTIPSWETIQFHSGGYCAAFSTSPQDPSSKIDSYWKASGEHSGKLWWTENLEANFQRFLEHWWESVPHDETSTLDITGILSTSKNAIQFAAYMAFTDWHVSLRRISAAFFTATTLRNGGTTGNINADNNLRIIQQFCTAQPSPEPLFWSFGQELNGIILLRQALIIQDIHKIDGILISLRAGRIMFQGERCSEIAPSPHPPETSFSGHRAVTPKFKPYPLESTLKLSSLCHLADAHVFVSLQALHCTASPSGNHTSPANVPHVISIRSELIAEVLTDLMVTKACQHDYYEPLPPSFRPSSEWVEGLAFSPLQALSSTVHDPNMEGWRDSIIGPAAKSEYSTYYQVVDGDGLHQWLACHFSSGKRVLFLMQRDACLSCTLGAVREVKSMHQDLRSIDVCIITGGVAE